MEVDDELFPFKDRDLKLIGFFILDKYYFHFLNVF